MITIVLHVGNDITHMYILTRVHNIMIHIKIIQLLYKLKDIVIINTWFDIFYQIVAQQVISISSYTTQLYH